jgi:dTDP-4-amino-4,6-dideoxygalactose transaminase
LLGGIAALASGGRGAAQRVGDLIQQRYSPRGLLLTNSGTGALTLALKGVHDLRPGPVALPAYSCFDVVTAAAGARVEVRLYDLDPATLAPDPESLGRCLREGVTAVVVAPLYGVPIEMGPIEEAASEHGAIVIEDAAQGSGAELGERPLGCRGSLGVLSFGRGKGVTGGAGGGLMANDEMGQEVLAEVADHAGRARRGLHELIIAMAQWTLSRPSLYALPQSLPFLHLGETVYRAPERVRELARAAAAILARTWEASRAEADTRRTHGERLLARLEQVSSVRTIRSPAGSRPGYLRLPVILPDSAREKIDGARRLGIMPGYPKPLSELGELAPLSPDFGSSFETASELASRLVTLPTHGQLREPDLVAVERWISSLAR